MPTFPLWIRRRAVARTSSGFLWRATQFYCPWRRNCSWAASPDPPRALRPPSAANVDVLFRLFVDSSVACAESGRCRWSSSAPVVPAACYSITNRSLDCIAATISVWIQHFHHSAFLHWFEPSDDDFPVDYSSSWNKSWCRHWCLQWISIYLEIWSIRALSSFELELEGWWTKGYVTLSANL